MSVSRSAKADLAGAIEAGLPVGGADSICRPGEIDPSPAAHHKFRRRPELDILRCVAVVLVLVHHFWLWPHWLDPLQKCGWIGVELFFVLSGYLVTGLVIKELRQKHSFDWSRFMLRRMLKIWPSYYVYLTVVMCAFAYAAHISFFHAIVARWPSFLHVQNYVSIDTFAGFRMSPNPLTRIAHTWSLAVEEHFYLLMPIAVALLAARGMKFLKRWLPVGLVAIPGVCLIIRLMQIHRPYSDVVHYWPTHTRLDGLCLGSMMTFCQQFYPGIWSKADRFSRPLLVTGTVLLLPTLRISRESYWMNTIGFDMIAVAGACILRSMLTFGDDPNCFSSIWSRGIAWVGASSYSIYLWQFIAAEWVARQLPLMSWPIMLVCYIASGLLGGVLVSKIVEFPMLRLRDAWFPARARTPAQPPPGRGYAV